MDAKYYLQQSLIIEILYKVDILMMMYGDDLDPRPIMTLMDHINQIEYHPLVRVLL